jgi:signal transduction histidine kinase
MQVDRSPPDARLHYASAASGHVWTEPAVHALFWILLGLLAGLVIMTPVTRLLLRRGERRAREAERRARQNERLAELGSMTGGLAHEIKNPLSTIGLNVELLAETIRDSELPEEERDRLKRRLDALGREVERLKGILTDFLQFAGRIRLDPQPHDLVRIVEELSDFFHPQCEQAGVMLRVDVPEEPINVEADDALLKQALLNLMVNAVQAMTDASSTPAEGPPGEPPRERAGELILRVDRDGSQASIHVIDTGPGIEPERMREIFRPYVSSKSGGTGLGLPTSRRIVEEHGGRLDAHSAPGRGSDFVIHLPSAAMKTASAGEENVRSY